MTGGITIKDGPEPLYQAIARAFRAQISSGELRRGDKIPSEEQLCRELGVSRGTLRKALGSLVEEGVLERTQGKGTYVANDKVSYPLAQELVSFAEELTRRGQSFTTSVMGMEVERAPEWLARRLSVKEGAPTLVMRRVRSIDGEPAVLLKNWVLLDKCPGLEQEDFSEVGLFEAIERVSGKRIKYGVRTFSARLVEKGEADLIGRRPGDPIMFITQLTYGQDDEPIEYSNILLRTDKYQVSSVIYR